MPDLAQFRRETRTWLEANCPLSQRESVVEFEDRCWGGTKWKFTSDDQKRWLEVMAARGWTAPDWPAEYGGGGLSKEETKILREEMNRINARVPLFSMGLSMIGPALLKYGSEALKRQHIRNIVEGRIWWCQGYSEPNYGSDLAGLQTRCEDKGDHYLINGQKVWTSYADKADWIFCLVRTDTSVKHEGISFILFDMESPGVEARPILLISGESPFCETFFTDVKVPKDHLVGEINKGWTIAKRLLQHEREMISGMGLGGSLGGGGLGGLDQVAKEYFGEENGKVASPALRERIAQQKMDGRAFSLTLQRSVEEAKAGHGPGAATSIFKYYGTELNKRRYELLLEILGTQGLGWEGEGFTPDELGVTRSWLRSKGNSIEGGTSEVQLNVVSKRVLGLPS